LTAFNKWLSPKVKVSGNLHWFWSDTGFGQFFLSFVPSSNFLPVDNFYLLDFQSTG